jgi:hypothetical protein
LVRSLSEIFGRFGLWSGTKNGIIVNVLQISMSLDVRNPAAKAVSLNYSLLRHRTPVLDSAKPVVVAVDVHAATDLKF